MLLWIIVVLIICACALHWLSQRRARLLLAGLPTYPQLPFLGNLHQLSGNGKLLFNRLTEISEIIEDNMKPFVLWLGPLPILITSDPDDVKAITNAFIEKPYYYKFGKVWLGDGLVTAPGSIWKQSIKKLAGTFNSSIVEGYQGVFNSQAQKLVDKLKSKVGAGPFDVMSDLAYTTFESICRPKKALMNVKTTTGSENIPVIEKKRQEIRSETALGVERISESIGTEEYYQAFNRCLELFISRGLNLILHVDFIYRLTPSCKELHKCVEVLHNVSHTVMTKRRCERRKKKITNHKIDSERENAKFKAFLDILMDLQEMDSALTEQQIKSEVDTIIVGGQETVASTLFYSLLMIGCNKRVQNKLYTELRNIFGDSNRLVDKEDISRMQYCDAIISETLRLFPPLPVVMRYADKELQMKSYTIPIGTACGINAWGAGRSRRIWGPDALEFRPERWLESDQPPGNPASFLAFSYGRRSCIGKKYAVAILKTMLAHCVRELEFDSEAYELEMKVDIVLRPVSGHLIRVGFRK